MHPVVILAHRFRGLAVNRIEELVHFLVDVGARVPELTRHHVRTQVGIFAAAFGGVSALQKQAHHAVALVHGNVGGQLVEVRKRQQVVREVRIVVPDVELVGDLRPVTQIAHEVGVARALLVRMRLARADGAQADTHVGTRAHLGGRIFGVPVSKRVDELVRVLLFDFRGHRVHKAQQRTRVHAAFFLLNATAIVAFAPSGPVVLRHRDDTRLRVLANPSEHVLHALLQQLRIGQAKLAAFGATCAVDQREPLRVEAEVSLGRNHLVERVHERIVSYFSASRFIQLHRRPIDTVARGPILVECFGEKRLAVLEGRCLRFVKHRNTNGGHLRNAAYFACEPAAAEFIEKRVNAVHGAALPAAHDHQMLARRLQREALIAQLGVVD